MRNKKLDKTGLEQVWAKITEKFIGKKTILTTKEQISANTSADNIAGALAAKAMMADYNNQISQINSNLRVNDLGNIGQGGRELYLLTYNHIAIVQVGFWGIQTDVDTLIGVMPNGCKPKHTAWARNVYENQVGYAQLNTNGNIIYKSDIGSTSYFQATLVCLI